VHKLSAVILTRNPNKECHKGACSCRGYVPGGAGNSAAHGDLGAAVGFGLEVDLERRVGGFSCFEVEDVCRGIVLEETGDLKGGSDGST